MAEAKSEANEALVPKNNPAVKVKPPATSFFKNSRRDSSCDSLFGINVMCFYSSLGLTSLITDFINYLTELKDFLLLWLRS